MTEHPVLAALAPRLALVSSLDATRLEAEETAVLGRKNGALSALLKQLAQLPE